MYQIKVNGTTISARTPSGISEVLQRVYGFDKAMTIVESNLINWVDADLSCLVSAKAPKVHEKADDLGLLFGLVRSASPVATYVSPYLSQRDIEPLEGINRRTRPIDPICLVRAYGQYVTTQANEDYKRSLFIRHSQPIPDSGAHLSSLGVAICAARGAEQIMKHISRFMRPVAQDESALA
jgi:hypothetical protein